MDMVENESKEPEVIEEEPYKSSFLGYADMAGALLDPHPLSKEGEVGDRMFSFVSGKVAFAILLAETKDSIIIAHPITLFHNNGGNVEGRVMCPKPVTRIFKSSLMYISQPLDLHRFIYLKFLMEELKELPALLEGARLESAIQYLTWYRKEHPEVDYIKSDRDEDEDEPIPLKAFSSLYKNRVKH